MDGNSFTCQSPASLAGQLVLEAELAECDNTGGGGEDPSPTPDNSDDDDVIVDEENSSVDNSALIISLSIVGAVLLFAGLSCFVYYKGSKGMNKMFIL